ncbi:MAG: hypothetical protein ACRD2C_26535 [Acidimicrobiales bacterium]
MVDRYPVEMLREWRAAVEGSSAAILAAGRITIDTLAELLEHAGAERPKREVEVDLCGGFEDPGGVAAMPLAGACG